MNNICMILHCSECGSPVDVAYKTEFSGPIAKQDLSVRNFDPEFKPGSFTVRVSVFPCERCHRKINGPAIELAEAIKKLTQGDKQ